MKRLISLITTAALTGALIGFGSTAHAVGNTYNLYLQPISPLNGIYYAGDTLTFAALVEVPSNAGAITLVLRTAVVYDTHVFDMNALNAVANTMVYPPKPSVKLWDLQPPSDYSKTDDGKDTFQFSVGHTKQTTQPGNKTTTIPAGTYSLGTFSFPIVANTPSGSFVTQSANGLRMTV